MVVSLQEDRGDAPPAADEGSAAKAPVALGRRDRKKSATRRALRSAALRLVAERGFAHVTVEDIAEAADVSTRTFFNYFPTKESAVVGADPERTVQMRMRLLERPADELPLEALGAVLVEHAAGVEDEIDDLGEGRESWCSRFSIVKTDPDLLGAYVAHITEIERALVAALAERIGTDPADDPYPALVTAAALAAARVAALHWSGNGGLDSFAGLTASAIECLSEGLRDSGAFTAGGSSAATGARLRAVSTTPEASGRGDDR
jgi:AcrR family transcriptional regulator